MKSILSDLFCMRHSTKWLNWSLNNNNTYWLAFALDNDLLFIFSLIFHFSLSISLQSIYRAFQYVFTSVCLGFFTRKLELTNDTLYKQTCWHVVLHSIYSILLASTWRLIQHDYDVDVMNHWLCWCLNLLKFYAKLHHNGVSGLAKTKANHLLNFISGMQFVQNNLYE